VKEKGKNEDVKVTAVDCGKAVFGDEKACELSYKMGG
jgi:hypothetical protein